MKGVLILRFTFPGADFSEIWEEPARGGLEGALEEARVLRDWNGASEVVIVLQPPGYVCDPKPNCVRA